MRVLAAVLWVTLMLGAGSALERSVAGVPDKVVVVEIRGMAFHPKELTVRVGTTVRWINKDAVPHDVTQASPDQVPAGKFGFQSPVLNPGDAWEFTFTKPGKYPVLCTQAFHYLLGQTMVVSVNP